ncbi:uncharacterized protein TM35_000171440 [Trypanosoma theileri]|uniref:DUF3456 domain-containing protein n=1 Tax=Trypanosoma theileri TaxID=67003 RepID=A0A1X0NUB5_9TRYP|nr:uncharacterized protein TM35_000171440 [Trypanosoma theileri]ORC88272.1 hypothetical protein TM35_000171440 [Trypanosoma theileri]
MRHCFFSSRGINASSLLLILCLLITGDVLSVFAADPNDPRFRIHEPSYAYLDCSACLAFAEYLGRRMNASLEHGGSGASFLTTHRLSETNKLKRQAYATSELRAVEVLEKICNDELEENFVLRLDTDKRIRVYESEKSDLPFAQHYSTQDSKALKETSKTAVRSFCTRVMGEEEEAMIALVREEQNLTNVEWRLCDGSTDENSTRPESLGESITSVCVGTEASMKAELGRIQRYEKWQEGFTKRREEAIRNKSNKTEEPVELKPVNHSANPEPFFKMSDLTGGISDDDDDEEDMDL